MTWYQWSPPPKKKEEINVKVEVLKEKNLIGRTEKQSMEGMDNHGFHQVWGEGELECHISVTYLFNTYTFDASLCGGSGI